MDSDNMLNSNLTEIQTEHWLVSITYPVVILIGSLGNLATIVVLLRLFRWLVPSCLYLLVGAASDTFIIWMLCGNRWVSRTIGVDIRTRLMQHSNSYCKLHPFVSDLLSHMSAWMMVAVAMETGLSYLRPKRLQKLCELERAQAVVLLVLVMLLVINSHCFWSYTLVVEETSVSETRACTMLVQGGQVDNNYSRYIWPVLHILLNDLLPVCLVFSFTVITVTRRNRTQHFALQNSQSIAASKIEMQQILSIHRAVICLLVVFLVCNIPVCVYDVMFFISHPARLGLVEHSEGLSAKLHLAESLCHLLRYISSSVKGIVLFVCLPIFRHYLYKPLMCCHSYKNRRGKRRTMKSPWEAKSQEVQDLVIKTQLEGERLVPGDTGSYAGGKNNNVLRSTRV